MDKTIFQEPESKTETLTVRLTLRQKESIARMANEKNVKISQLIIGLVGQEYERLNSDSSFNQGFEYDRNGYM